MNSINDIRAFLNSTEKRFFVYSVEDGPISIKNAYLVKTEFGDKWVRLYLDRPFFLTQKEVNTRLFTSKDEAWACQQRLKEERDKKKAKLIADLEKLAEYIDKNKYRITKDHSIAKIITKCYSILPDNEKDDQYRYIHVLEKYINTGVISTQGMSFSKEQVVHVKYGKAISYIEGRPVEIELSNGTRITPASRATARLISILFPDDYWGAYSFNNVTFPEGNLDIIQNRR